MAEVYPLVTAHVAEIAGRCSAMDDAARLVLGRVRAQAAAHRLTGDYISKLVVEKAGGGKDRLVSATDPAAVPIEFGYLRVTRHEGSRRVSAVFVPGLHIMGRAYAGMGGSA